MKKRKINFLNEDEEQVVTPVGFRPKSQVFVIEEGYHIDGKGGHLKK